jgi:hypothetical protein
MVTDRVIIVHKPLFILFFLNEINQPSSQLSKPTKSEMPWKISIHTHVNLILK